MVKQVIICIAMLGAMLTFLHVFRGRNRSHNLSPAHLPGYAWATVVNISAVVESPVNKQVFATSLCNGRLGNVMSAFAALYAYKEEFGITPLVPKFLSWLICYYFQCKETILTLEEGHYHNSGSWAEFDPDNPGSLDENNPNAPNPALGQLLYIGLYPFKVKYYHRHISYLKSRFLTLKEPFQKYARDKIEIANRLYKTARGLSDNDTLEFIGIHSRNEDYAHHLQVKGGYVLVDEDYFTRAMNYFRHLVPHPVFIITSNDMDWAKEKIIPVDNDCYFFGTGLQYNTTVQELPNSGITSVIASPEIGNDLALLSQMNYSILTYGTFGIWGALLAESKIVITPTGYDNTIETLETRRANISGWIEL